MSSYLKPESGKHPSELTRIVYIVSDINKALSFEWVSLGLKHKFDLSFILINKADSDFAMFLKKNAIRFYEVGNHLSRLKKWIAVFRILQLEKPAVVHTHLWQANLAGLSASWILRIKKRIYTRHHATVHYHEYPAGRKWDLLCNFLATDIIAISESIKEILIQWDKVDPKKIKLIRHGFDIDYFSQVTKERVYDLRVTQNIHENDFPVVGVIARYMKWKGIQYVIPAFQKILSQLPNAKLILANAHGSYEPEIKQLLAALPPSSVIEIQFVDDIAALYKVFDVFVHVPIDPFVEAFGQTYVEALASGVPSVFTLSGIASEFIRHEHNALVVPFEDSQSIYLAAKRIVTESELRKRLVENGKLSANLFLIEHMIESLTTLYEG